MKLVSSLVSSSAIVVPKKSSSYPITRRSGHPPQVAATVGGSGPATSTCRRIDSDGTVSTITKTSLPLVQISRLQRFVNASRSMKEMMEWLIGLVYFSSLTNFRP
uniref:Uncharacterized protein n=1 Tax=Panagrellus redivivus TaxID=6233 RepID=A0A7E4W7U7_PANRE